MPTSDRRPCKSCHKPTKVAGGVCQECLGPQAKRPERPCKGCGKRTTAKSQECRACEPTWMKQGPITYAHAVYAETPGQWVQDGLVRRWVPREVA